MTLLVLGDVPFSPFPAQQHSDFTPSSSEGETMDLKGRELCVRVKAYGLGQRLLHELLREVGQARHWKNLGQSPVG